MLLTGYPEAEASLLEWEAKVIDENGIVPDCERFKQIEGCDRLNVSFPLPQTRERAAYLTTHERPCLLYTSDAADE